MSEIQENTEAKLAAYIDGDLDGSDRAEIEKLLEQNPNYRRVLDQLRQTRQLLRGLPRESAPPELSEIFNSQLERSVLLDGISEPRPRSGPLNRWPQFMMAAAVVLLTVGLGTVVYFVLPKSRPPIRVADSSPPSGAITHSSQPTSAEDEEDLYRQDTNSNLAGEASQPNNAVVPGLDVAAADPSSQVGELALDAYQNPQVQSLLYETSGANTATITKADNSKDALVMIVRSNDPQQLQKQVVAYLDANNISWSAAPQQVPVTLNLTIAQSNKDVADALSPWQRILGANESGGVNQLNQTQREAKGRAIQSTTQPAKQETPALADQAEVNATPQMRQNLEQQLAKKTRAALAVDNVYVARRLSRVQLVELNNTLTGKSQAGQNQVQQVQLQNVAEAYQFRMRGEIAKTVAPTPAATEPSQKQVMAMGRYQSPASQPSALGANLTTEPAMPPGATQPAQFGNAINFVEGVRYFRSEANLATSRPTTEAFLMDDTRPAPSTMPTEALYLVLVVQNDALLAPTSQESLEHSAQPPATQATPANPQ